MGRMREHERLSNFGRHERRRGFQRRRLFDGRAGDSCIGITMNLLGREDADTLKIEFDVPQRAITRGQAVVLYDGDLVAGGGTTQ